MDTSEYKTTKGSNLKELKSSFRKVLNVLPSSEHKQVIDVVKSQIPEMRNAFSHDPNLAAAIEKSMLSTIEKGAWAKYGKPAAIGATALAGIGGLAWLYNSHTPKQSSHILPDGSTLQAVLSK